MESVSFDCFHPLQKTSQFVLRRVSADVPLDFLHHLLTQCMLNNKTDKLINHSLLDQVRGQRLEVTR